MMSLFNLSDIDQTYADRPSMRGDPKPEQPRVRMSDMHNLTNTTLDSSGHLQFIRDEGRKATDKIFKELITLQCEQRKMQHAQAIVTANVNSFLAGRQLGLPVCNREVAVGDLFLSQKCDKIEVTIN